MLAFAILCPEKMKNTGGSGWWTIELLIKYVLWQIEGESKKFCNIRNKMTNHRIYFTNLYVYWSVFSNEMWTSMMYSQHLLFWSLSVTLYTTSRVPSRLRPQPLWESVDCDYRQPRWGPGASGTWRCCMQLSKDSSRLSLPFGAVNMHNCLLQL